jgi:hypothetical protein
MQLYYGHKIIKLVYKKILEHQILPDANVTCTQLKVNIKACKLTVGDLAAAGYVDYDNATTVTNPQTGDSMNAETIEIKYNTANNSISIGEYK